MHSIKCIHHVQLFQGIIFYGNFNNKNSINKLSSLLENLLLIQSHPITIRKDWEC